MAQHKNFIFGLGTGRCGTKSLASLQIELLCFAGIAQEQQVHNIAIKENNNSIN